MPLYFPFPFPFRSSFPCSGLGVACVALFCLCAVLSCSLVFCLFDGVRFLFVNCDQYVLFCAICVLFGLIEGECKEKA